MIPDPVVRLKAPLFSLDATGTLAGVLTYAKLRDTAYIKRPSVQPAVQSDALYGMQRAFSFMGGTWSTLTADQQASWELIAAPNSITSQQAYTGYNCARVRRNLYPSAIYPASVAEPLLTWSLWEALDGVRSCKLRWTVDSTPSGWAIWICRHSVAMGGTPYYRMKRLFRIPGPGTYSWLDHPLPAGLYHYECRSFNFRGRGSAMFGDRTATSSDF